MSGRRGHGKGRWAGRGRLDARGAIGERGRANGRWMGTGFQTCLPFLGRILKATKLEGETEVERGEDGTTAAALSSSGLCLDGGEGRPIERDVEEGCRCEEEG